MIGREEALSLARSALAASPVDPRMMEELRGIIPGDDTLALWLCGNNGWLWSARPLDVWREDPEGVLDAAKRAVEPPP